MPGKMKKGQSEPASIRNMILYMQSNYNIDPEMIYMTGMSSGGAMDNVMLNGYMVPYVYLLFILLMPFETPRWIVLLSGFALGLTIDLWEHTPGMWKRRA